VSEVGTRQGPDEADEIAPISQSGHFDMQGNLRSSDRWQIDFSLALFNRSGKYFIGRDIIDGNADLISAVYYWRLPRASAPQGVVARLIGKLEAWEHGAIVRLGRNLPAARAARSRCLHLDPLSVLHRPPRPDDLVICHDLGPVTDRDLFAPAVGRAYDLAYELIHEGRSRLVFVSKSSAAAYAQLYGPVSRAQVIYPPIRAGSMGAQRDACPQVRKPFLLTVGSIGKRKNQAAAIRAYAKTGLAGIGLSYVLCGGKEPGHEEVARLAAVTPGVVLLPYVTDANLRWLYGEATGFVLASRLEGFGMPVAEAMQNGLIPVVSAGSVLEEVAGSGAITVDPTSEDSIAAGMKSVVALDSEERRRRTLLMQQHVKQFSEAEFRARWRDALTA
jgi:glycosyltransferase involved in cell wall biosynthesis